MVAVANSSTELVAGQSLDRYELVYPVARGGMASVWVAKLRGKHGFEKLVALKTILPTFARDGRFRRMFLDEAKIASGIEHVNVAQILDLGEQAGQLYLVMEWVDGDSLEELDRAAERAGAALPIPILIRVIADACAGLHAAHELTDPRGRCLNVVHRDVSPQNILISAKGVVKVIDFGVVKARRRTTEETSTGTIKGKLQYMAPEQALGHPVDRRADIWAVGATLYRLLARRPVFAGNSPLTTFDRLTSAVPPEALPAHVPGALSTIVHKALAFDRERRYASCAELGAALEALLQGPYQTTAREVAGTMDQYLGEVLTVRRHAIVGALTSQHPSPLGGSPVAAAWESGISQAQTLPRNAQVTPLEAAPTVVERRLVSVTDVDPGPPAFDDETRRLTGEKQETTSGGRSPGGWMALGGAGALAAMLVLTAVQAFRAELARLPQPALAEKAPRKGAAPADSAASQAAGAATNGGAGASRSSLGPSIAVSSLPAMPSMPSIAVSSLPVSVSSLPVVRSKGERAGRPAPAEGQPLSVQALPALPAASFVDEAAAGASKPTSHRATPRTATNPNAAKTRRKVVDDGF